MSRLLKEHLVSPRRGQRIGPQSETLRTKWQTQTLGLSAEQLVFIDEPLFKEAVRLEVYGIWTDG